MVLELDVVCEWREDRMTFFFTQSRKSIFRRVHLSNIVPFCVIVPRHFLEDSALTGKSTNGRTGFY